MIAELGEARHVELFAGGGGLAAGAYLAGIRNTLLVESDPHACSTLRTNASREKGCTVSGIVAEADVGVVTWPEVGPSIDILSAGAPCQPFSIAGISGGYTDSRNGLPEIIRAMGFLRPRAVLVENVPRLASEKWKEYFDYFIQQLQYPSLMRGKRESWREHARRIEREQARGTKSEYVISQQILNAADYGVPQTRRRLFIVAFASKHPPFTFPAPTHSRQALEIELKSGAYWHRHNMRQPKWAGVLKVGADVAQLPWTTVRDALAGLPKAADSAEACSDNHWSIPGAKAYKGHSGSRLDMPAKTVKAGVHGVPGGENSLIAANGKLRYFTMRELARIQTFPDGHYFEGARIHVTRQIGNAVPCRLAMAVYSAMLRQLPPVTSPDKRR